MGIPASANKKSQQWTVRFSTIYRWNFFWVMMQKANSQKLLFTALEHLQVVDPLVAFPDRLVRQDRP